MRVLKRDGRLEEFNASNIRKQTALACEGLDCDPSELELSAGILFRDGMPTHEIQEALIRAARLKVKIDTPKWTYVAARLHLYDLYHNVKRYYNVSGPGDVYKKVSLLDYIEKNQDILADYWKKYTKEEIEELNSYIDPKRDLLYDYAGMRTMTLRYLMKRPNVSYSIKDVKSGKVSLEEAKATIETMDKDKDGKTVVKNIIVELPQHMHMMVAMFSAQFEKDKVKWARDFYHALSKLEFIAATPINSNSRKPNGSTASCFVTTTGDDLDSIAEVYRDIMQASSGGGGVGRYIGFLRSTGSRIQDRLNASSGIVPNCKVANDITEYIDQMGKQCAPYAS